MLNKQQEEEQQQQHRDATVMLLVLPLLLKAEGTTTNGMTTHTASHGCAATNVGKVDNHENADISENKEHNLVQQYDVLTAEKNSRGVSGHLGPLTSAQQLTK